MSKFFKQIVDKSKTFGNNVVCYLESHGNNLVDKSKYVVDNTICKEKLTPKKLIYSQI
jgi:hypothetical protein